MTAQGVSFKFKFAEDPKTFQVLIPLRDNPEEHVLSPIVTTAVNK